MTDQPAPEQPLHIRQAEGLRRLADMLERSPEIAGKLNYTLGDILVPVSQSDDAREELKAFVRAAKRVNADLKVRNDDDTCHVIVEFGPVAVRMYASAERMAGGPEPKQTPEYEPLVVED